MGFSRSFIIVFSQFYDIYVTLYVIYYMLNKDWILQQIFLYYLKYLFKIAFVLVLYCFFNKPSCRTLIISMITLSSEALRSKERSRFTKQRAQEKVVETRIFGETHARSELHMELNNTLLSILNQKISFLINCILDSQI
jgi:hypothetical protein